MYKKNVVKVWDVYGNYEPPETKVIDNNSAVEERLEIVKREFLEYQRSHHAEEGEKGEEGEYDEDSFLEGISAKRVEVLLEDEESGVPHFDGPSPEELIAEAKAEAEGILDDARAQAVAITTQAKRDGFESGQREAAAQIQGQKQELERQAAQLQASYEARMEEMEAALIEELTGIYEHIFRVDLSGHKDLVMNLLSDTMHKADGGKDILVHVSKEDYKTVSERRQELRGGISDSVSLEIIEDVTLSRAQCMIETMGGIYDCSLDTQLEGLTKEIRLLSYTPG